MGKRKQNSLNVGEDINNSIVQVGDNPTTNIHANIDNEELGQSLGETLSGAAWRERFWEMRRESDREDSRQVMETVLVSLVSGLAIGASWQYAFPWNLETVPFFVIGIIFLFNVLNLTHFGLRHSIFKVVLLVPAFLLLLRYTSLLQTWMGINQFVGALILATIGAIIGLFVGVIQTFWHPLED